MSLFKLRKQLKDLNLSILIAEDNQVNCYLLQIMLKNLSRITLVSNGEEAVHVCNQRIFNIIILDLNMPKLNGIQAGKLIKQSKLNRDTPIIFLSAANYDDSICDVFDWALYLQKPIQEEILLTHILNLIEKLNIPSIDWTLCIQKVSGNVFLARDYLMHFMIELEQNRQLFIELMEKQKHKELEHAIHKLHGACCFSGVPRLQRQISSFEILIQECTDISQIQEAFIKLIKDIDDALSEYAHLKTYLSTV